MQYYAVLCVSQQFLQVNLCVWWSVNCMEWLISELMCYVSHQTWNSYVVWSRWLTGRTCQMYFDNRVKLYSLTLTLLLSKYIWHVLPVNHLLHIKYNTDVCSLLSSDIEIHCVYISADSLCTTLNVDWSIIHCHVHAVCTEIYAHWYSCVQSH